MKKATITLITSAALAFAIPLYAADTPGTKSDTQRQAGSTQQQTDKMQSGQMSTEKPIGMKLLSQGGEEIGEIKEVMFERQSGKITFVTISRGGTLGIGAEEIAVPLSAIELSDEQAKLTVDHSKLDNVPHQNLHDLEIHYGVDQAREKGDRSDTNRTRQMNQNPTETGDRGDTTKTGTRY